MEITWVCDACDVEVGRDGHLLVRSTDQRRWRAEHRDYLELTAGKTVIAGSDVTAHPAPCRW